MSPATGTPSRAPSSTWPVTIAVASGEDEPEAARTPAPGRLGGAGEQQPFLLVRGQVHGERTSGTSAEPGR
jgi:hypothetical protein